MKVTLGTRKIGELEHGILIKRGSQAQLFRIYDGFGLAKDVLELSGLEEIHIYYEGTLYKVSLGRFKEKAIFYNHPKFEAQYILPRKFWSKHNENQPTLL